MAERSAKQLGLSKADLPNSITEVIATLNKGGFEAYIVGGGVRDTLLGLNPKDFDAVTDAKPHEIKDLFGKRCRIIGRRFQLAHVYSGRDMIEVATFRAPPKGDAHTTGEGMIVRDNVWGDINQDFERRDFSINAMYYQPLDGVVYDFCNAFADIKSKTLRLLGRAPVRIEEDPVRLLRALRFKAKLGFEFDAELSEQFHDSNWSLLDQVSPHRLYDESQKMFTGGYLVPLLPLLFEYGAIEHLIAYPPKAPSALVTQVAINTDKRIASGKSINPAFFYAALLWDNYLYHLNKNKNKNMPFYDAQQQAAHQVIGRQRLKTAIPKFAEQFIRDIWLMQPNLANPRVKQIAQLAEKPRFRAAFDFLLLREQCDDAANPLSGSTNGMGEWWQAYQELSDAEKQQAIDDFSGDARRGKSKRKRNRNRNRSGNQETQATDSNTMQHTDKQADNTTAKSNPVISENKTPIPAKRSRRAPSTQVANSDTSKQRSKNILKDSPDTKSASNYRSKDNVNYSAERQQLKQLTLDSASSSAQKPAPLFKISADKMAKQVPNQAAVNAKIQQGSTEQSAVKKTTSDASTAGKKQPVKVKSELNTAKHNAENVSKSSKVDAKIEHSPYPQVPAKPDANGLFPKAVAVPYKRSRRQPSSELSSGVESSHKTKSGYPQNSTKKATSKKGDSPTNTKKADAKRVDHKSSKVNEVTPSSIATTNTLATNVPANSSRVPAKRRRRKPSSTQTVNERLQQA